MRKPKCPVCQGSGRRLWSSELCPNCEGLGEMPIIVMQLRQPRTLARQHDSGAEEDE